MAPGDVRAPAFEQLRVEAAHQEDTPATAQDHGHGQAPRQPMVATARVVLMAAIRARGEVPAARQEDTPATAQDHGPGRAPREPTIVTARVSLMAAIRARGA